MGTPLHTIAELRAIEQIAQRGLPAGALMARAGAAAAAHIGAVGDGKSLTMCILAGPGNNGGDGYVTASELRAAGHDVTCVQCAEPATDDARNALAAWKAPGAAANTELPVGQAFDVIIDALLGIGQTRPLHGELLAAAQWINTQRAHVVAIDVPSGLDADRGHWVGGVEGVNASETITFIGDKPGLHTGDGIDAAGVVTLETLDAETSSTHITLTNPSDFPQVTAPRRRNSHKGSYGTALIVGGNTGMVGAALLAARAALRIGAGRVIVDCIGAPEFRVDPCQPELMFRSDTPMAHVQAIIIGCGLGSDNAAQAALQRALASDAALVVDADALNLLAGDAAFKARAATTVLTPHPLEAARLLNCSVNEVQGDRIAAAHDLAARYQAVIVLKGAGTVIAHTDGRCAINPTGGPALATAGTGDALAGLLGGLIAQGFDHWQSTLAAVWLHGRTADVDRHAAMVASDIAPHAAAALSELRSR